jgi:hypothetical protein
MMLRHLDGPPEDARRVRGGREVSRKLGKLCGRVGCSTCAGVPGCLLERGGHASVSAARGKGEMTRSLLRVADETRQTAMDGPSRRPGGGSVDGRTKKGMREADAPFGSVNDPRLFSLRKPRQPAAPLWHRSDNDIVRGTRGRGHDE